MKYLPKKEVLSFEEMERLMKILATMGVTKVRITGGEPFVRNDLMKLLRSIRDIDGINDIHLTTNGILTAPHVPELKQLGIASVNLSLDTLDKDRFTDITRRDELEPTIKTLNLLQEHEIPVKINAVVMEGKNTQDIIPLAALTRNKKVGVRFIEEMPFNGKGLPRPLLLWNYRKIYDHLSDHFGELIPLDNGPSSTATNFRIQGHEGTVGIIAAYSRTFCGTCNRIRITPQGGLKTCLYGPAVLNLKDLIRQGASDAFITEQLMTAFRSRAKDGFEAEKQNQSDVFESMSTIGG